MEALSENYVSVVMVLYNDGEKIESAVKRLDDFLKSHFRYYEFVFVDNASTDDTKEVVLRLNVKNTLIEMPVRYKSAQAVEAGIDCAVGDYIFEISDIAVQLEAETLEKMYDTCQQGNDFVFAVPDSSRMASKIFYHFLNKSLRGQLDTGLTSSVCILSSRRGQNRVAFMGSRIVNRTIAYALVGLPCAYVPAECSYRNRRGFGQNLSLMIDSFIYYTSAITHLLIGATVLFAVISLGLGIYSVISYFCDNIVEGWTSTILYISCGFAALFLVMSIIIKYLEHILKNTTKTKEYLYKNLTKN